MFFVQLLSGQKVLESAGVQAFIAMRCSAPLVVFLGEAYILDGPKPSMKTSAPLFVMVIGAWMFLNQNQDTIQTSALLWGTLFLIVMPTNNLVIKKSLTDLNFSAWGMVYYHNLLSLIVYIPVALLTGEYTEILEADLPTQGAMLSIAVTCALGVSISAFGLNVRHAVRATTFTILGVLNKIITMVLDAIFQSEEDPMTLISTFAIVLLIGGGLAWQIGMGKKSITMPPKDKGTEINTPRWVNIFNLVLIAVSTATPIYAMITSPAEAAIFAPEAANTTVRVFDLGGSGMRTAVFQTSDDGVTLSPVGLKESLGQPDPNNVSLWIREKVPTLDAEIEAGYEFGGSGLLFHLRAVSIWSYAGDPLEAEANMTASETERFHWFWQWNASVHNSSEYSNDSYSIPMELVLQNSKYSASSSWDSDTPTVAQSIVDGKTLADVFEIPTLSDESDCLTMLRAAHVALKLGSEAHLNLALGTGVAIGGMASDGEIYNGLSLTDDIGSVLCSGLCTAWPGIVVHGVNMPVVEALGGAHSSYPSYTMNGTQFLQLVVRMIVENMLPRYNQMPDKYRPTVVTLTGKVSEVVLAPLLKEPYRSPELNGVRLEMGPFDGGIIGAALLALDTPLVV